MNYKKKNNYNLLPFIFYINIYLNLKIFKFFYELSSFGRKKGLSSILNCHSI